MKSNLTPEQIAIKRAAGQRKKDRKTARAVVAKSDKRGKGNITGRGESETHARGLDILGDEKSATALYLEHNGSRFGALLIDSGGSYCIYEIDADKGPAGFEFYDDLDEALRDLLDWEDDALGARGDDVRVVAASDEWSVKLARARERWEGGYG
ncbi:hypothetical protein [Aquimonas sp.]|jgi:hypothetical protein|uniref:hypothetical protein n=1 Tax=Aquimonas sp. TaxID=1872588 RepID=UPI0037C008BD